MIKFLKIFQALYRRWRALGLEGCPDTVLRMTCALALLPPRDFIRGAEEIRRFILDDPTRAMLQEYIQFANYVIESWSPLAEVVSVFDCPTRTNNYVEGFYRHALKKLGGIHPNIFVFLGIIICLSSFFNIPLTKKFSFCFKKKWKYCL